MRRVLPLLLISCAAWGAAYTSKAAGNWSASGQTTWNEAGVPGNGDTVTITHAITVDVDTTVGTSPSDSTTLAITSSAAVTIGAGVTFTVRGSWAHAHNIIFSAGSKLHLDPSQATTRSAAAYIVGPNASLLPNAKVIATACTSTQRCEIRTLRPNGDEARARFGIRSYNTRLGAADIAYTDITDWGDAGVPAFQFYSNNVDVFRLSNVTMTRTGPVLCSIQIGAATVVEALDVTWTDSLDTTYVWDCGTTTAITTGVRNIKRNYFDKRLGSATPAALKDFTFEDNVFYGGFYTSASYSMAAWTRNVVRWTGDYLASAPQSMSDTYIVVDNSSADPDHFAVGNLVDTTLDGFIFEYVGPLSGDTGEAINNVSSGASRTHTIQNSIVLPQADGTRSGVSLTNSTVTTHDTPSLIVQRNTVMGDSSTVFGGLAVVDENYYAGVGTVDFVRSNIYWDTNARNYPVRSLNASGYLDNAVDPAGVTHNNIWQAASASRPGKTSDGTPYNAAMTGTVPGANDTTYFPGFPDTGRRMATWAAWKGGTASIAGAFDLLRVAPAAGIASLLNYVRQGFAPTEVRLATSGHDGGRAGAVQPIGLIGGFQP